MSAGSCVSSRVFEAGPRGALCALWAGVCGFTMFMRSYGAGWMDGRCLARARLLPLHETDRAGGLFLEYNPTLALTLRASPLGRPVSVY